ncbi:MAG: (4Fe-4S)-binding protein [Chitinophagales bacterium]|nr:(4Fe-4S)-binding protein [Chitinophagales bacterium]
MDLNSVTKKYDNGEITVVWKPGVCIHSKKCWTGLPKVFNPQVKPWVNISGADTEAIIAQVDKCPSGALSYFRNEQVREEIPATPASAKIEVTKNGPLLIHGDIIVQHKDGNESIHSKVTAFCRCGQSGNKPFCDGTHRKCGFKDE